jgi:hypothetical protein
MKRPDLYKGRSRGGAAQQRFPARNPAGGEFKSTTQRGIGDVKDKSSRASPASPYSAAHYGIKK